MTRISKLLALALRHKPEALGFELDPQGWADVQAVLSGVRAKGYPLDRALLEEIVVADAKQRYRISPDGSRIRASQGHSRVVDLSLVPSEPPGMLYHGTTGKAATAILREGLLAMKRQYVHLSTDTLTARQVGLRRAREPVILAVDAGRMWVEGRPFYKSENGVWLAERVDPAYLRVADD